MSFDFKHNSIDQAINGLFPNDLIFLSFTDLEPDLAGLIAMVFFDFLLCD